MGALTGDEVISAVSLNIRSMFSEAEMQAIYKNLPQQNIKKPYAFIHLLDANHKNEMRNRANWSFMLDVRVHPKDNETEFDTWARLVAVKLINAINVITVSEQSVKSSSIEYKPEDNVLHFIVSYAFKVVRVECAAPDMQNLTYGQHTKK